MLPDTTFDDLKKCAWKEIINSSPEKTCLAYAPLFSEEASKLDNSNPEKRALQLLAATCYMEIDWEVGRQGFIPIYSDSSGSTPLPIHLSEQNVEALYKFLDDLDDSELKARIADAIWLKKARYKFEAAKIAIVEYKKSIDTIKSNNEFETIKRLCRLIYLTHELGKGAKGQQEEILNYIQKYIIEIPIDKANGLHCKLLDILYEHKYGAFEELALKCNRISDYYESIKNFHLMRSFLALSYKFLKLSGADSNALRDLSIHGANSLVEEANNSSSAITRSVLLKAAIDSFRQISDSSARIKELHTELIKTQENIPKEMVNVRVCELDATELVRESEYLVSGYTFFESLIRLIYMIQLSDEDSLRVEAILDIKEHPLLHLLTKIFVNDNGKITGYTSIKNLNNINLHDDAVTEQVLSKLLFTFLIQAEAIILPAINKIVEEHNPSLDDLMEFVNNNIFVPPGHELYYAKWLLAGFNLDFVTASLYLVPQIENSIRYVLRQNGIIITSTLESSGVQKEIDLNSLLNNENVIKIFDENIILVLRAVMTDRYGWNIRNSLAHGLINYDELQGPFGIICWWLTLRLIMIPVLIRKPSSP